MASDELRFEHIGISSDGAVIFCAMDNGQTSAMSIESLKNADGYNAEAKPKRVTIIHDGYAAVVQFDNKVKIEFPSDFVRHTCDPSYRWYKDKVRNHRQRSRPKRAALA